MFIQALCFALISVVIPKTFASDQVRPERFNPPKNDYGKSIYPFVPYSTDHIVNRIKYLSEDSNPILNLNEIVSKRLNKRKTTNAINKGQQPWMSTYWPLNKGLIADPYEPNINVFRVDRELTWRKNYKILTKRSHSLPLEWTSFDQQQLDQMAPSEKYDILLGDSQFTLTNKVRKYMYDWGSKKENAFMSGKGALDLIGENTLNLAQNYVDWGWLNGDDKPFSSVDEALPLAIKNKGGLTDAIAMHLIKDGKAYTYDQAYKLALPLAKKEQSNYVLKKKSSLLATWEGICHGWSTAAGIVPRPNKIVSFKLDNGKRLKFYPDDLKALASYMFANSRIQDAKVVDESSSNPSGGILMQGLRCNDPNPGVDPWGRFYDDRKDAFSDRLEPRCVGVHPAIWHLALVNIIGKQGRSFVVERKISEGVDNHPMSAYKAEFFDPYTAKYSSSALKAVRPINKDDQFIEYRNPQATHIVGVRLTMTYVNWKRPKRESYDYKGKDEMRDIEMIYDLELDKDKNIVGGQWRAVEKGRGVMQIKERKQPDFFWIVTKNYKPFFKQNINLPYWDGNTLPPKEYRTESIKAAYQTYQSFHDRCEVVRHKRTKLNKHLPKYLKVNCKHIYDRPQPLVDIVRMLIRKSNTEGKTF